MRRRLTLLSVLALALSVPPSLLAQSPRHPLDGFSSQEYWTLFRVLREAGLKDSTTTVTEVGLAAPPKADVLAWRPGQRLGRTARVVLRAQGRTIEAFVSLDRQRVVSQRDVPGAVPTISDPEYAKASGLTKKDPRVIEALKRRGVTDLSTVSCGGGPPAYFPDPRTDGRRVLRTGCRLREGTYNSWSRQFEGLVATVDIDAGEVLEVIDTGVIPPATGQVDFDEEAVGPMRPSLPPIQVSLPQGTGFSIDGGEVSWDRWKFHLRIDPRVGSVVSLARITDGTRERSVLYEGHLSEIFVPYQDSTTNWYDRTFLDVGEYSSEGIVEALQAGVDCPTHAVMVHGVVPTPRWSPAQRRNLACLFERTTGIVAWRHGYEGTERVDGKAARELVVRTSATVGNYDYLLD